MTSSSPPPEDTSKTNRKRHSPLVRLTGRLARLTVLAFCLYGAYLTHSGGDAYQNKLSAMLRNLADPKQEEPKETTANVEEDITAQAEAMTMEASTDNKDEKEDMTSKVSPKEEETPKENEQKDNTNANAVAAGDSNKAAVVEKKKPSLTVPNVLVVGAQESGTTAVASWLFHHGSVCKPHSLTDDAPIKEARYFDSSTYEKSEKSPQEYSQYFAHCKDDEAKTHIVDATPEYFQHADRVVDVYNQLGDEGVKDLRVVVLLREPVDREFAYYWDMVREAKKDLKNPPAYTRSVLNKKGQLFRFDRYMDRSLVPKLKKTKQPGYAKYLEQWMNKLDRKQLLVLSHDELATDRKSAMGRLESFLELGSDPKAPTKLLQVQQTKKVLPSCAAQAKLAESFKESNTDLYKLLDAKQGPDSEQRPFPRFELTACKQDKTSKDTKQADSKKVTFKKKTGPPPTNVFFATHHKTGTDISRSVATLLRDKGLAEYSEEVLDETDLMKNGSGETMECKGSTSKPEIRSYNQWPKWIIDNLWGKCVGKWWDSWPSDDTTTNDLFDKCIKTEMDALREQLKMASCGNDYLVVHFVRNPVDLMLSSYRYTKLGKEEWMHENIVGHPRFVGDYCGGHDCFDMTIQEAIRDLPVDVGLKLEVHLVSMEIVKQMMVGSALAKADPEHHIEVSLSDIMESSESFQNTWTHILSGVYPSTKPESISKLVDMLKIFDMNHDPENFAGNTHSTSHKTNAGETEQQKKHLFADSVVEKMLKDPHIKTLI